MPKKKKTLKQKMLTDIRHEQERKDLYSFQVPHVPHQPSAPVREEIRPHAISTVHYQYLAADLRKTLFFALFAVLTELIMYYFL